MPVGALEEKSLEPCADAPHDLSALGARRTKDLTRQPLGGSADLCLNLGLGPIYSIRYASEHIFLFTLGELHESMVGYIYFMLVTIIKSADPSSGWRVRSLVRRAPGSLRS